MVSFFFSGVCVAAGADAAAPSMLRVEQPRLWSSAGAAKQKVVGPKSAEKL
jgi:hypothetical protein